MDGIDTGGGAREGMFNGCDFSNLKLKKDHVNRPLWVSFLFNV